MEGQIIYIYIYRRPDYIYIYIEGQIEFFSIGWKKENRIRTVKIRFNIDLVSHPPVRRGW